MLHRSSGRAGYGIPPPPPVVNREDDLSNKSKDELIAMVRELQAKKANNQ